MRNQNEPEITIKVKELDELNNLILQLINIKEFTKKVQARVEEVVENDPLEYIDEEGFVLTDKDNLIDQAVESEFEAKYEGSVPTAIYETVHEQFDNSVWDTLTDLVNEVYRDSVEYAKDPLGYHGLKQSDFL
jgi:hypothetical protein